MPRTSSRKKLRATTAFEAAIDATRSVRGAHQSGRQALLRADRERIVDKLLATGSLALDDALRGADPHGHRWDYGIGLRSELGKESVVWLEVHHSASGEAQAVIRKLEWLKRWLRNDARRLDAMPRKFVWQLSNVERHPNDRLRRNRLAEQHGLRRVEGRLRLADHA
jgi:hypothetical protein